jgi:endonuclease YncB( thermonuclease family)
MALFEYRARVTRPYDGDSFWVLTDSGYIGRQEPELRLYDVYMPELKDPGGPETARFVLDWFAARPKDLKWPLYVRSIKTKVTVRKPETEQKTTLARYLAIVWECRGEDPVGVSLNDEVNEFLAQHPEWGHGKGTP